MQMTNIPHQRKPPNRYITNGVDTVGVLSCLFVQFVSKAGDHSGYDSDVQVQHIVVSSGKPGLSAIRSPHVPDYMYVLMCGELLYIFCL